MLYLDRRDTDLCVEPELFGELKENFSVRCLWVAVVIVCLFSTYGALLLPSSCYGLPQPSTLARVDRTEHRYFVIPRD